MSYLHPLLDNIAYLEVKNKKSWINMKSNKMINSNARVIRLIIIVLISILIFTLVSCIIGVAPTPPPGAPNLKITAPKNNVPAGNVTVSVDVSNFNIVNKIGSSNNKFGEGHIIYYLDVAAPTYYDHPAITVGGSYKEEVANSYIWTDVTPGNHTFSVQLVNNNNNPLPAAAVDSVTIKVDPPQGNPTLKIANPQDSSELPPGIVIVTAEVNNFIISHKDMGAVNRAGEGHLIFYIDEDPPTDQGQPAITETSIVSTNLQLLWKPVPLGNHTFSIQLVNNDDTPLNPAVIAKVSVTVKSSG
jgi:hypothetical protein